MHVVAGDETQLCEAVSSHTVFALLWCGGCLLGKVGLHLHGVVGVKLHGEAIPAIAISPTETELRDEFRRIGEEQ